MKQEVGRLPKESQASSQWLWQSRKIIKSLVVFFLLADFQGYT
jgi:hypothetical protein